MTILTSSTPDGVERVLVKIGKVTIIAPGRAANKVILQHADGEAGEFDPAKLEDAIEQFFWREF
jgi:hypothetical protein